MNPYMNKKYQILQQQADQAGQLSGAQAAHIQAETGELPANSRAQRAAQYGQADASAGQAYHARAAGDVARANIPYIGPLANSEIQQRSAQAGLLGAQANVANRTADADFTDPLWNRMGGGPGAVGGASQDFANRAFGKTGYGLAASSYAGQNSNGTPANMKSVTQYPGAYPGGSAMSPALPPPGADLGGMGGGELPDPDGNRIKPIAGGFAAGTSNFEGPHDHHIRALGAALGFKPAPQPAPQPAVPGHASGTSDFGGGTSSYGNNIGAMAGASFAGANPAHGSDPRDIPGTSFAGGTNVSPPNSTPGYAAGTSNTQDDQGMQPNPSGAPLGAAGGSPAPVGQTGATSWGGVGMPVPEPKSFKKGTDKVGGKGSGKVDTQPAMLAPGEAVLNKAAAEHLGRDTIDLLNAAGAQKMGLSQQPNQPAAVPASQAGAQEPGYAAGTSSFPPKKAAPGAPMKGGKVPPPAKGKEANGKTPAKATAPADKAPAPPAKAAKSVPGSKGKGAPAPAPKAGGGVSPAMVQALAGMMGGGGMPAPGGPAPQMGAPAPQPMGPPQLPGLGLR